MLNDDIAEPARLQAADTAFTDDLHNRLHRKLLILTEFST